MYLVFQLFLRFDVLPITYSRFLASASLKAYLSQDSSRYHGHHFLSCPREYNHASLTNVFEIVYISLALASVIARMDK
jgi:hypothetical protein